MKRTPYKVNQDTYARLIALLLTGPATAHKLAEVTGLHIITTQSLMRAFRKYGAVHVSGWEADALDRDCTPVFSLGHGKDVPRRAKSRAEIARNYRSRRRLREMQQALINPRGNPDDEVPPLRRSQQDAVQLHGEARAPDQP